MKKHKSIGESTASTLKKQRASLKASFLPGLKSMKPKSVILQSASPVRERSLSSSRKGVRTPGSSLRERLLRPNADGMVRISAADLERLPQSETDWKRFDSMSDEDIARAVADDPDAAPLDLDWSKAKLYFPKLKQPTSLRLDPDVVAFFKSTGKGYQTRMNAVLRAYMEHELGRKSGKT